MVSVRLFLLRLGGAFWAGKTGVLPQKSPRKKHLPTLIREYHARSELFHLRNLQRAHPPQFKHLTAFTPTFKRCIETDQIKIRVTFEMQSNDTVGWAQFICGRNSPLFRWNSLYCERTHEHKHQGIVPTSSDPPSHDAEMLLLQNVEYDIRFPLYITTFRPKRNIYFIHLQLDSHTPCIQERILQLLFGSMIIFRSKKLCEDYAMSHYSKDV